MSSLLLDNLSLSKERADRLRRLRNLANLSRKNLCEGADININTYIGYEVAKYGGITKKSAEKIINYIQKKGVYSTIEWLMTGFGLPPKVTTDFHSNISMSESKDLDLLSLDLEEDQKIAAELSFFLTHYSNSIGLLINDDGMSPSYDNGDYVAGINNFGSEVDNFLGSDCIVKTADGILIFRTLTPGRFKSTYTLSCSNPKTNVVHPILYDVSVISAAAVIWHRRPRVINYGD